jgi:organic radical activating enzyme
MDNKMKIRIFPEENYKGIYVNGKTFRIALDPDKPISELKYPEFYDVKITDKCFGLCPYCYMDSRPEYDHYDKVLFKIQKFFGTMTVNQRPFQVAIGGGEPTECPEFIEVLEKFYSLGITPNYTTNGMWIDRNVDVIEEIIDATKRYCGGVAVSCHPHLRIYWERAAEKLADSDIKLNFHLVISDVESIDAFKKIFNKWEKKVDYFVLLPYGSQGRAKKKDIEWEYLVSVLPDDMTKIAFGANFYPYLIENRKLFNVSLYEPESMSKFLDLKDMKLYPSSFMLDKPL